LLFLEQTVKKVTLESGHQLVVIAAHPEVGWATQYKGVNQDLEQIAKTKQEHTINNCVHSLLQ
jgi:hypothetical protein